MDFRDLLASTNEWMNVFSPIVAYGLAISVVIAILAGVSRWMIARVESMDERKAKEDEKAKGLPPALTIFINRLLDRILGEPMDKRKNEDIIAERLGDPADDGEIVYMETEGLTDDLKR